MITKGGFEFYWYKHCWGDTLNKGASLHQGPWLHTCAGVVQAVAFRVPVIVCAALRGVMGGWQGTESGMAHEGEQLSAQPSAACRLQP